MCTLAVHWGWRDTVPGFPDRLRENPPRQGFFEHPEYLAVRAHLPAPWQDILDLAYYSGWRKNEILGLTWDEIDEAGGIIRLSPGRSKTLVGRILPISQPIAEALSADPAFAATPARYIAMGLPACADRGPFSPIVRPALRDLGSCRVFHLTVCPGGRARRLVPA